MSFSAVVKNELSRVISEKPCCQLAEISGFVRMGGTIQIGADHAMALQVTTENPAIARKIFTLCKKRFGIHPEIAVRRRVRLHKNNTYLLRITPDMGSEQILQLIGVIDEGHQFLEYIDPHLVRHDCCRRAYLRGSFLGGGSVTNPEQGYHLELVSNSEDYAKALAELINTYPSLQAKIILRKNFYVVYMKEGEQIVDFLNIIGAHSALLNLENIRIYKDLRNQTNRLVNCETANLNKTVEAAVRQIEQIRLLDRTLGLDKLPKGLREIAALRLQYPEASLKELGEMLSPPVGKSGVNHRLRKLEEMAGQIESRLKNRRRDDERQQP